MWRNAWFTQIPVNLDIDLLKVTCHLFCYNLNPYIADFICFS